MKSYIIQQQTTSTLICFHKKYEPLLYTFMLFAIGFIGTMIFFVIPLAEYNNVNSESNVLSILKAIFSVFGSILLIATIHEVLKREWIEINKRDLIIGNTILGRKNSDNKYLLKNIRNLKKTPLPIRGWKVINKHNGGGHQWKEYSNDSRKVYPTISFNYEGTEVMFASGLKPDETDEIILIIKNLINGS